MGDHVKIHTIFPGTILSPGLENENKTKPDITFILEESDPQQTPDQVAKNAIAGLENGGYLIHGRTSRRSYERLCLGWLCEK